MCDTKQRNNNESKEIKKYSQSLRSAMRISTRSNWYCGCCCCCHCCCCNVDHIRSATHEPIRIELCIFCARVYLTRYGADHIYEICCFFFVFFFSPVILIRRQTSSRSQSAWINSPTIIEMNRIRRRILLFRFIARHHHQVIHHFSRFFSRSIGKRREARAAKEFRSDARALSEFQ